MHTGSARRSSSAARRNDRGSVLVSRLRLRPPSTTDDERKGKPCSACAGGYELRVTARLSGATSRPLNAAR